MLCEDCNSSLGDAYESNGSTYRDCHVCKISWQFPQIKDGTPTKGACDCATVIVHGEVIHELTCALFDGMPLVRKA